MRNWNVNIPPARSTARTRPTTSGERPVDARRCVQALIVTYKNGAPVRLGDVAHVIDSVEDDKNFSNIYGGEYGKEGTMGVNLSVMRQPAATPSRSPTTSSAAAHLPGSDAAQR
jgi:HAE1 family hydrophobic/amphiphilic exporter-1